MKRSLYLSVIFILAGAVFIQMIEGHISGAVGSFWESMWWSFTTMVTGGFGDLYNPTSGIGRGLTVVLIIAGMVLVGIFTATLTSILVRDDAGDTAEFRKLVLEQLTSLQQQVSENSPPSKD